MTLAKRLIPCLDIMNGRVVKGTNFVKLRDAGDPVKIAYRYSEEGADEIILLDIIASSNKSNIIFEIIEKVASKIFIPLTVGGGVRTMDDVRLLLNAGADKVNINTSVVENPQLIAEIASKYGSQCVIIVIDVKQIKNSIWQVFTHRGHISTNLEMLQWATKVKQLGAGEILLTSMNRDGTNSGFDLNLIRIVSEAVTIPMVASDGVGNLQDLVHGIKNGKADAVLAASIFHDGTYTIQEAKHFMANQDIPMRLT